MLKQFYQKVLPSQGIYCVTAIDKGRNPLNRFAENLDDLITIIEGFNNTQTNVFVATGSFIAHSRRAENAYFMRSFFIDLDVGKGKDYASKEEALEALDYLLEDSGLPPPVRIDSGGGVHAYWIFDEDIPVSKWKPYADKFKAAVSAIIPIDPVVTADVSRIMRAPFTLNYKYEPPLSTSVLSTEFDTYSFAAFVDFLGQIEDVSPLAALRDVPRGLDDDTREILKTDNIETVFDLIATKSMEGNGCNQIKYMIENAALLSEPLWHSGLSIARQCVDWEEAIHELSREYVKYNAEQTVRKANETYKKPHSCIKIEERNVGGCDGCQFRGTITNPLALGRHLKEAPALSEEDTVREVSNGEKIPTFPDFLRPFVRGAKGGIYFLPPMEEDDDGKKSKADPILLLAHDLFPLKRMYSPVDGECLMMRLILPNDGIRDFNLPMKSAYTLEKLREILASVGVGFNIDHIKLIMNYIIKWNQYMITANTAEQMRMQMGWTDDFKGFVVGHHEIRDTGEVIKTASSPMVNSQAKLLAPVGDYDKWRTAANMLNSVGFDMHAFGMLIGFGSPLMRYTSTSGGTVCFMGPSGNAKTGALYAALSIYGNPKGLALDNANSATQNGFVQWYLGLKNVPFGLDEASNFRPDYVSDLIHKVSQGKGKVRVQSMVNAIRVMEESASMIAFMTSNQSLYDKLTSLKTAPDGEVARLIEFNITRPKNLTPEIGREIFDTFRKNYGHAIYDYMAYIYRMGEPYVQSVIDKWVNRFAKDFGNDSTYRFYFNMVGVSIAGGQLACEAGIIDFNIERIYRKVLVEVMDIRDKTIKINDTDFLGIIGEYMNINQAGALVLHGDRVTREPRTALVIRVEVEQGMYYVSKTEFKKYLATIQVSGREFDNALTEAGILTYRGKQRLSKGWSGGVGSPVAVYGFKIDVPREIFGG